MCGIAGIFSLDGSELPAFNPSAVLRSLHHRGPDDRGVFYSPGVFLGATRLSIIDPAGGRQPVSDESGRFHLVMNGEIYGYAELLAELKGRGHCFRSQCDTEVACHLVEEDWAGAVERIDGQFAVAAYDSRERKLLLMRDRMGISPLFYARRGPLLVFASEMKALFATGLIEPEIDRRSLDAIAAFGCVPAPRTVFRNVSALPPGCLLEAARGNVRVVRYWDIPFPEAGDYPDKPVAEWSEGLREHLHEACRRRLRADVPVGVYLSGGVDSGTICALLADADHVRQRAYSVGFAEPAFDETARTRRLAAALGVQVRMLPYTQRQLCQDLPRLIYHAETPLLSTESIPLMALSGLAARDVKVVLTGEGSDEALGGYIYFRWEAHQARYGHGRARRQLLKWIWSPIFQAGLGPRNPFFPLPADRQWAEEVFGYYPAIMTKFLYFRMLRELVYSEEMLERQQGCEDAEFLSLPRDEMRRWDVFNRTLYLSARVFLAGHLLAAHGDRALMANSVEGRYPFLDRQVQEFLAAVPPRLKCRSFQDKYLLRRAMRGRLPREVVRRVKKPFLAPFGTPFVGPEASEYIRGLLAPESLAESGFFDPYKVAQLVAQLERQKQHEPCESTPHMTLNRQVVQKTLAGMALTFVVSTQVLFDQVQSGRFGLHLHANDAYAVPPANGSANPFPQIAAALNVDGSALSVKP